MNYKESTQVPNILFDSYIPQLKKPSEIIILLIIIRQTLGWYNPKTKKRKERDWITHTQFKKKTGLSIKTISKAINHLISLNLVQATDSSGKILSSAIERKGKVRIYYQCLFGDRQKSNNRYVKSTKRLRKNVPITKLTYTKLNRQKGSIKRISDTERFREILEQRKG